VRIDILHSGSFYRSGFICGTRRKTLTGINTASRTKSAPNLARRARRRYCSRLRRYDGLNYARSAARDAIGDVKISEGSENTGNQGVDPLLAATCDVMAQLARSSPRISPLTKSHLAPSRFWRLRKRRIFPASIRILHSLSLSLSLASHASHFVDPSRRRWFRRVPDD